MIHILESKAPLYSLSYTIAALNPASCALLTFSSNVHPPLTINTNEDSEPSIALLLNKEHPFRGSARYKTPFSPDSFISGAKKTSKATELIQITK